MTGIFNWGWGSNNPAIWGWVAENEACYGLIPSVVRVCREVKISQTIGVSRQVKGVMASAVLRGSVSVNKVVSGESAYKRTPGNIINKSGWRSKTSVWVQEAAKISSADLNPVVVVKNTCKTIKG